VRENLRPVFQRLPKWVLLLLAIAVLPLHLTWGAFIGIGEYYGAWQSEFKDIWNMKESDE
jgi:hypothetical protein